MSWTNTPEEENLHTWFWIKSLTRSIGAAAVLETAAETPPTVIVGQQQYYM